MIKEKVKRIMPLIGTHVNLRDPIITEILGSLGYDFLFLDMEHMSLSEESVYYHLLAARSVGTPIFVRVPVDDLTVTKHILEMGPEGIIFPMVRDYEHAKRLLDETLYPPFGFRGCGPRGAVRYGLDDEAQFYQSGHLKMCRFVQIEMKSAALDAKRIARLPYLDGCILGMHDLSGSVNKLGDVFCEENVMLAKMAIDAFKTEGKTVGVATYATDDATLERYRDMGINMISAGADYEYVIKGAKATLNKANDVFRR